MYQANCKSWSEFLEYAAEYLPAALVSAFRATIQGSETHIARLLFKLTVEISTMMHVLAAGLEIDDSQLDELRWRCVQEVKKTNGGIKFKNVLQEHDNGGVRLKQTLYKSYDDLPLMRRWRRCWVSAAPGPMSWCGAMDSPH